jgi:hypothetical protein
MRNVIKIRVRTPQETINLGRRRYRLEDNIKNKVDLGGTWRELDILAL